MIDKHNIYPCLVGSLVAPDAAYGLDELMLAADPLGTLLGENVCVSYGPELDLRPFTGTHLSHKFIFKI